MRYKGYVLPALLAFLTAPSVYALETPAIDYTSFAKMMGSMWNLIGSLFSFEFVSNSPAIQQGILKFIIFILILRVVQVGAKKKFDGKTSGIIGFSVAAITVLFTPNTFLLYAIVAIGIPLIAIGWLVKKAMFDWTEKWIEHLFGLLTMFANIFLMSYVIGLYKNNSLIAGGGASALVLNILNLALMIIMILFIVKIIQMLMSIGGAGSSSTSHGDKSSTTKDGNTKGADKPENKSEAKDQKKDTAGPTAPPGSNPSKWHPSTVSRVSIAPEEGQLKIAWEPVENEKPFIDHYRIEYRNPQWFKQAMLPKWTTYTHLANPSAEASSYNTNLDLNKTIQVRVRAEGKNGKASHWAESGKERFGPGQRKTLKDAYDEVLAEERALQSSIELLYEILNRPSQRSVNYVSPVGQDAVMEDAAGARTKNDMNAWDEQYRKTNHQLDMLGLHTSNLRLRSDFKLLDAEEKSRAEQIILRIIPQYLDRLKILIDPESGGNA